MTVRRRVTSGVTPAMPDVETMGVVGTIAPARQYCLLSRLYRHRADNLNMSSTWLWPRNDLIANVGVLVAAGAACLLASRWSDIIVGYIHRGAVSWVRFQCLRDATRALCLMRYTGQVSYGRPGAGHLRVLANGRFPSRDWPQRSEAAVDGWPLSARPAVQSSR